jgi:hypothetical protein
LGNWIYQNGGLEAYPEFSKSADASPSVYPKK